MESVFLEVAYRRQLGKLIETRLMLIAAAKNTVDNSLFEQYLLVSAPPVAAQMRAHKEEEKEALTDWSNVGPVEVIPLIGGNK